jgi:nicotinamide-nucleotide adenylyltransferase
MTALFIGRFQPFHLGHLDALKQISKDNDFIKIGIGSSDKYNQKDNPYDFDFRSKLINEIKNLINSKIEIFSIPDIDDDYKWVSYVGSIVGDYDIVFSGNDHVLDLFARENIEIKKIKFNIDISASKIRDMILNKEDFKKYLPKEIWNFLS